MCCFQGHGSLETRINLSADLYKLPPAKIGRFTTGWSVFIIFQNAVLYLGGVCTPVYPSFQSSMVWVNVLCECVCCVFLHVLLCVRACVICNLLWSLREGHAREGRRQRLRVHLAARALQVVVLPLQRVRTLKTSKCKDVENEEDRSNDTDKTCSNHDPEAILCKKFRLKKDWISSKWCIVSISLFVLLVNYHLNCCNVQSRNLGPIYFYRTKFLL